MNESRNIAARMGRWSAQHRKIAIWGWLAGVAAAFFIGSMIGQKNLEPEEAGVGESGRVDRILADDFETPAVERVMIQSPTVEAGSPAFKAVIADVVKRLDAVPEVAKIDSPLDQANFNLISADRHTALVDLEIIGDPDDAVDKIAPVVAAVDAAEGAHSGFVIESFGVTAEDQINGAFEDALKRAGELSLPITLAILLLAFGALVAAGIPLLLALTAVIATMGLIAIPSQIVPLDQSIGAVVLLIGLAVGVDYTMFYLKREREERWSGKSEDAALQAAAATSGRSVLISGLTVIVAMAGMLLMGDKTFAGFGIATITVVAVAVLGSLTVLPALLSWLGDRVDKGKLPYYHRFTRKDGEGRFWSAILGPVLRRPLIFAILAAIPLVALGLVSLQMKLAQPGPETFPPDLPAVQTYKKLQEAFPGNAIRPRS